MNVGRFRKISPLVDKEEYRQSKESVEATEIKAEQESGIGIKGGGKRESL